MVFYDTVYAGILRIAYNEQHLWSWFRQKDINPPLADMRELSYLIEGELNGWDWDKPLVLSHLISKVYYKWKANDEKI